ncbi:MAG: 2-dehydro-3-deoxygalactonokinase [Granulosicoccus sp.]
MAMSYNNTVNTQRVVSCAAPNKPVVLVDWGTSSLRVWCISANGNIVDRFSGPLGLSGLARDDFERVLEEQLSNLCVGSEVPAVICGMAGAAQGWYEAPYISTPCTLSGLGRSAVKVPSAKRDVWILPGIMQLTPGNVMRGEETQLLGLHGVQPDFNGVVCLPGTHSKWVRVQEGRVEQFTTCMTGEFFGLLSQQSVLKHSVDGDGWNDTAFNTAVSEMIATPEKFADTLFSLRADRLLADLSPAEARGRLSGLLVGIELAATRAYWSENPVALLGDSSLCSHYAAALTLQAVSIESIESEATTIAGLCAAFLEIQERYQ